MLGAGPEAGVSAASAAAKRLREGIAVGAGGCLLIAATGHVTGRAPDGRRPSSAPSERPARPRPWGAATAARTRTQTRCGRRGRGSGMRAETLGHGSQKKACRRGGTGRPVSLSTEARRGQIKETPGRAPTVKASVLSAQSPRWGMQAATDPTRSHPLHLPLPSNLQESLALPSQLPVLY